MVRRSSAIDERAVNMIRRRLVLAAVGCAALALGAAGPAEAATADYRFGNVDCSVVELTGYGGIGLATYLPTVRAIDATRGRDVQTVSVRSDLYKLNLVTDRPERVAVGETYTGLAADDNYVVSFRDVRTGQRQLIHERLQWILSTNGFYRVRQHITWFRRGRVPGGTSSAWLYHSPGYLNGKYCYVP
jgi:hypothetical protein